MGSSAMFRVFLVYSLSGFVSLGYQVAWFRIYVDQFGSTNLTFALVLCNFIAGLGLGALASKRLTDRLVAWSRIEDRLRLYGVVELLVTISVLLTVAARFMPADLWGPFPYELRDGIYVQTQFYLLSKLGLATLSIFVPCFFMGVTFPLLCYAFRKDDRFPSALYAWNTLGACSGVLACEFVLLPQLGHDRMLWILAGFNLLLAAYFLFAGGETAARAAAASAASRAPHRERTVPGVTFGVLLTGAVLSGLLAGALEGDMFQRIKLFGLNTSVAMSFISFWAILGIFLGSWSVRALPAMRLMHIKIAFVLALITYYLVGRFTYPIHEWVLTLLSPNDLASLAGPRNFTIFFPTGLAPQLLFVGIVVFPAFLLVSLLLPYVCNRIQRERRHLGLAYGANTLAFCVGIVAFTWIAPRVSIFYSLKLMIVWLSVGVALLASMSERRRLVAWKPLAALAAILAGCLLTPAGFDRSYLMPYGAPARYPIRAMKSDGAHTTFVVSHESGDRLYFGNTSLSNTSLPVQTYMGLMAHVPLLAQRRPERALLICYGVGNTATAIAAHETIREIDIVELSINVIRTAPEFSAFTNEVHLDPRVRFIHDDGRNFLNVSDRRYDLITSEPPPPLHDGVFRLYSRQYYEQALAHLTPNGMMTQWLPVWQLPGAAVDLAISTFVDVFPHTLLFLGLNSEFIILGSPAPIDLLEIERRFDESDRVRAHLKRLGITSPVALFFRMIQGDQSLRHRYGGRGVIRDTHNDLAHLFVDLRQPGVIPYDPLAMLAELRTERLGVYEELRGIVTHLGRLRYHIPGFPIESLLTVRATSAREVELADVDWRAIGRIEQQAGRLRGAGSTAEAGEMLLQSFHLAQEQPALLLRLAQLYLRNGLDEDAGRAMQRFRRIEPNETIGLYNLGVVFEKQGDTHRAIASYRQALDLDPSLVAAVKHLAWMLATSSDARLRDGNEAVRRVERLMQATGNRDADVLATLAAAYAETGDFDAAVGWQTKALHLAPENRIADYRASLQRYADHESYRQDPRPETRAPWDPRFRILLADR